LHFDGDRNKLKFAVRNCSVGDGIGCPLVF
jgi:hypothetical protein